MGLYYGGITKTFTTNLASNTTNITMFIGDSAWARIYMRMPTMSTGAAVVLYGSLDGSTYLKIGRDVVNTAASTYATVEVGTSSSGMWCPIPVGFSYYKFQVTGTVCANTDINLVCVPF
jgi:hypothetical protein